MLQLRAGRGSHCTTPFNPADFLTLFMPQKLDNPAEELEDPSASRSNDLLPDAICNAEIDLLADDLAGTQRKFFSIAISLT